MRIDKFLWCVRFFKTRSIATEEIKKNRVSIGSRILKSAAEVLPGETLTIRKNQVNYKIKVIQIPQSRVGAKLVSLYIKDMTDPEQLAILESRKLSQKYYRDKGEGRPTKRDRRDLTGFLDQDDTPEKEESEKEEDADWDSFFNGEDQEY